MIRAWQILPGGQRRGYAGGPSKQIDAQLRLLGGRSRRLFLLPAIEARVAGRRKFAFELLDPTSRVDELQLARVERVADVANIDLQFLARAAGHELVAAAASYLRFVIFRMNAVLHGHA